MVIFPTALWPWVSMCWEDTERCMNLLFHLNKKKSLYHKKTIWHYSANLSVWHRIRTSQIRFSRLYSVNSEYLQRQRFPTLFGPFSFDCLHGKKISSEISLFLTASKASHPSIEKGHSTEKSLCSLHVWYPFECSSFGSKNQHPPPFPIDHVLQSCISWVTFHRLGPGCQHWPKTVLQ